MSKVKSYLKSINALLKRLYDEEILISDILKKTGLPDKQIAKIKKEGIRDFLNNFYRNFNQFLDGELPSRHYSILTELYGLEKTGHREVAQKLELPEERVKKVEETSFDKLRNEEKLREIEGIIVRSAQDALSKT